MHATSHDLKRETHLTEGHLVLPVLVAEGDHHLGRGFHLSLVLHLAEKQVAHLVRQPLGGLQEELPHRLVPPLCLEVHPQQMDEPADGLFSKRDLLPVLLKLIFYLITIWKSLHPVA